ncbi:MAG TPA: DUF6705 family protein [Flavobacterium sp.]|uniref:DUF6705 family protein n=1 Tax=Flavobacterium sp. TaxID=239 RepID=UPI002B4B2D59|nr:DUF6705 family protein [Flavobacterium sp.]HLO72803.1 DUF6705 family protein [Flavobacterium sp.]
MKIIILLLLSLSCKAQSPILDISESGTGLPNGYYLKDTYNLLNPFEGIYEYTNGNTSFKIVLVKKVQQYNGEYYEDLIIGEYQYIENGIVKVNTLSELNTVYSNQRVHKIDSNFLVGNNFKLFPCTSCLTNEKRLYTSIMDPISKRYADLIMRRTTENGQEVMKIKITNPSGGAYLEVEGPPAEFSLPLGELTLIKQ